MQPKIVTTADGSHTLKHPLMDEHYHSINGAVTESKHVYIHAGWKQCVANPISVLEMGFGTGLNALLTCIEANNEKKITTYTAFELYPLDDDTINQLNYNSFLEEQEKGSFKAIHDLKWEKKEHITPFFQLEKIQADFTTSTLTGSYDLVYYDAFDPAKQPELWNEGIFAKIYKAMNDCGVIVTYSAKGMVRRAMEKVGFKVDRIAGPPGKREMIRGYKNMMMS